MCTEVKQALMCPPKNIKLGTTPKLTKWVNIWPNHRLVPPKQSLCCDCITVRLEHVVIYRFIVTRATMKCTTASQVQTSPCRVNFTCLSSVSFERDVREFALMCKCVIPICQFLLLLLQKTNKQKKQVRLIQDGVCTKWHLF